MKKYITFSSIFHCIYLSSSDNGKHVLLIFEFLQPHKIWHIMRKERRQEKKVSGEIQEISKWKMALKEIRTVFLLVSSSYAFLLMAVWFYVWDVCVCVCMYVCACVSFGVIFEYIPNAGYCSMCWANKVRMRAMVCVLMELGLTVICGFFFFFFRPTNGIWKFPGQGSIPSPSCDLHHSCSDGDP